MRESVAHQTTENPFVLSINETGIYDPFRRAANPPAKRIPESATSLFNFQLIQGIYPAAAAPGGE
jgi:hypothetical protein